MLTDTETDASSSYMAEYGQKLLDGGFRPIPIEPRKKSPGRIDNRGGWINLAWERYKTAPVTPAIVRMWGGWPECGIGIICGDVVAVDIDLNDEAQCDLAYGIFNRMLGATPAVRIGRPPRRLLVYRTDVPFRKISAGPVEVLAEGQQFVAYGIHPDGHEYHWPAERLHELTMADLPTVTEAQVREAVNAVLDALPAEATRGARIAVEPENRSEHRTSSEGLLGTHEGIAAALEAIPNDDKTSWDDWNKVGMAIFCARGPSGFDLFEKWSQKSSKCGRSESETPFKRWASYMRSPPDRGGAGTIYYLAEETGWRLDPSIDKYPQPDRSHIDIIAFTGPPAVVEEVDEVDEDEAPRERGPQEDTELPEQFTRCGGLLQGITDWICSGAPSPNRPLALGAAIVTIGTIIGRCLAGPTGLGSHTMVICMAGTGIGKDHPMRSVGNILTALKMESAIGSGDLMSTSALYTLMSTSPLNVSCIDEYGDFLKKITNPRSPATNGILRALKEMYSVNLNYSNRVDWAAKKSERIYFPSMSIYGVTTFEQFFDAVSSKDVKDGFINRHILIATNIKTRGKVAYGVNRTKPSAPLLEDLIYLRSMTTHEGNIGKAFEQVPGMEVMTYQVPWSTDGKGEAVWDRFNDEVWAKIERGDEDADFWQRTGENALKLALIHAASRLPEELEITEEDMEWGRGLASWSTLQMIRGVERYVSENDNQRDYKTVLERIRAKGGIVTRRKLAQSFNGRFLGRRLDEVLSSLVGAGEIEIEVKAPRRGGHPVHTIKLKR
jgi:hypothetical protein